MTETSSRTLRKVTLTILQHFPRLRWQVRRAFWSYKRKQYEAICQSITVEQKTVFLESYSGRSYACSPRAIFEALCADPRFEDWQFYWSFQADCIENILGEYPLLAERAKLIERGTRQYYEACAKANYWVINNRMPEWVDPEPDQVYVQCWHGTPLKRLGFDLPKTAVAALNTAQELSARYHIDAQKWIYLLSSSTYASEHLLTAFGMSSEINCTVLELGYPRNDYIVNTLKSADVKTVTQRIKEQLHIPCNKRVLLYAPTWRESKYKSNHGYVMDYELDFDMLNQHLGHEWVVLLRSHYYIRNKIDLARWGGFVVDVSNVNDINDLYVIADALMTDYSSVLFDYANTGRPLILYFPDYDYYKNESHGFYMDPMEIPGYKCFTSEEVVLAIESLAEWDEEFGENYQEFRQRFCPMDDGSAAKRVIEQVFFFTDTL